MKYPKESKQLSGLLAADQQDRRSQGRAFFSATESVVSPSAQHRQKQRANRLREILSVIGSPRLSRVGSEGVEAIAVMAMHAEADLLAQVTTAFLEARAADPADVPSALIPPLLDWQEVLARQPQPYGSLWFFDADRTPYLYQVAEPTAELMERRAAFGLGPIRWPRSLAIPVTQQPWLTEPLGSHVTRMPTDLEFQQILADWGHSSEVQVPGRPQDPE